MNSEEQIIKQVTNFIKGGDTSNQHLLNEALHKYYRNVQVGFFGEPGVYTMDKSKYLQLIEEKTFGGIPRTMEIESIDIEKDIAMVKANLKSEQLTFKSFISLVRDQNAWKVIGNFPYVVPTAKS